MPEFTQAAALIRFSRGLSRALARAWSSVDLAKRFAGHHRRGKRDVQAAAAASHRDDEAGVGSVVNAVRHAGRFATEQQDVAIGEIEFRVGQGGFGRKQHQPAAIAASPLLEAREVEVPGKLRHFEVIHAGAPEIAVGTVKAGRLDDVDAEAEAGRHAQDGAGIAGDVRLVERDADASGQFHASLICGYPATVVLSTEKNHSAAVAFRGECGYRAGIVNTNRRRQAWNICLSLISPAELVGLQPDGGFGSTLFLTFSKLHRLDSRRNFSRSPKESSDVFQTAARPEGPA